MLAILPAGLPNIVGTVGDLLNTSPGEARGAFYAYYHEHNLATGSTGNVEKVGTTKFDAALSNAIYGNADTVQPPAFVLVPQIKY